MQVTIRYSGESTTLESFALQELNEELEKTKLEAKAQFAEPEEGTKDGGLIIAISIASLAVASIGTLISAIALWNASLPGYSVSFTQGDITETVSNISPETALAITKELESSDDAEDLEVTITKD